MVSRHLSVGPVDFRNQRGHSDGVNARAATMSRVAALVMRLSPLMLLLSATYAVAIMVLAYRGIPLWYDESWSALIQQSGSVEVWVHRAWSDSSAPLYYAALALWPLQSDDGMRLLSLLFFVASAALAAVWRAPGVSRGCAALWATLLILWSPGQPIMLDARYYALLLLLSVAQTIAFLRLVSRPALRAALIWSSISALAILTHYYSAVQTGLQGLLIAWLCRRGGWPQLLPALLPFVVPFGWLASAAVCAAAAAADVAGLFGSVSAGSSAPALVKPVPAQALAAIA